MPVRPVNSVMTIEPWVRCLNCGGPFDVVDDYFERYFSGSTISCPNCAGELDWWEQVLYEIRENFIGNLAYSAIGARTYILKVYLREGKTTRVEFFKDLGIPDGAHLLHVNYSPRIGLFPTEMHGNVPIRHGIPPVVNLWPRPLGKLPDDGLVEVDVVVTWVTYSGNEYTWQSLVDAFQAFGSARYREIIIPANVAVEFSLYSLLSAAYEPVAGSKNTEDLLDSGATYSNQLNALLPVLVKNGDLELLPDHIRGQLNRLRKMRNQMAHQGSLDDGPLEHNEAARLLCAALFGFRYLEFARSRLTASQ